VTLPILHQVKGSHFSNPGKQFCGRGWDDESEGCLCCFHAHLLIPPSSFSPLAHPAPPVSHLPSHHALRFPDMVLLLRRHRRHLSNLHLPLLVPPSESRFFLPNNPLRFLRLSQPLLLQHHKPLQQFTFFSSLLSNFHSIILRGLLVLPLSQRPQSPRRQNYPQPHCCPRWNRCSLHVGYSGNINNDILLRRRNSRHFARPLRIHQLPIHAFHPLTFWPTLHRNGQ